MNLYYNELKKIANGKESEPVRCISVISNDNNYGRSSDRSSAWFEKMCLQTLTLYMLRIHYMRVRFSCTSFYLYPRSEFSEWFVMQAFYNHCPSMSIARSRTSHRLYRVQVRTTKNSQVIFRGAVQLIAQPGTDAALNDAITLRASNKTCYPKTAKINIFKKNLKFHTSI